MIDRVSLTWTAQSYVSGGIEHHTTLKAYEESVAAGCPIFTRITERFVGKAEDPVH